MSREGPIIGPELVASTAPHHVRVVQHIEAEGPGRIGTILRARGVSLEVTRVDLGERVPADLGGASGLVVMGGPMGVYEMDAYPHLRDEQRLLERALRAGIPVLGVCLGAQLLAATLGARVAPGPAKEIGWLPVTLRETARDDALFGGVPRSFTALHWHGDVFDLPSGAVPLASSALTEHQAFRSGDAAYGLLFHLEATTAQVETMARVFERELADARVDAGALLAATERSIAEAAATTEHVFGAWADLVSGARRRASPG